MSLLSGGLQIVMFPKTNLFFLCWFAFIPLLYALLRGRGGEGELVDSEGRSLRPFTLFQGFLIAWACGIAWYIGTCYWIYPVMNHFGNLGVFASGFITLGFCLIMGMHHGVFGLLVVLMARRATAGNRRPLLLAPVFWVAIEFFRDRITGVPWEPLGNAQVDNIPFARISEFAGVYGLSLAIMLVNCAFVAALLFYGRRRKNLLISATAAAIALQMGVFLKPAPLPTNRQALLIQPNVPIVDVWSQELDARTLADFVRVGVQAGSQNPPGNPGLIVWPESPAPFYVSDSHFLQTLKTIAQQANSYLIVGSSGEIKSADGANQLLNSALVVDPQGNVIGRYDKMHLVPFGEYVPFKRLLFFADKLTREVGDFVRGTERKVFDLNGTKVGVVICYESVFPGEVREFAANGAQVFVNISNDEWYGETSAPYQHLQMTRMRAIENHRWILLATNNGVTASIDPLGRVVKKAERNISTVLTVPFSSELENTFYSQQGDVFAWICVVISLLAIFVRFRYTARTMLEARPTP
ncbi:MAG TPA: apolipoprotein N-acyltransferase [Candidatus Angelobacter sp.]